MINSSEINQWIKENVTGDAEYQRVAREVRAHHFAHFRDPPEQPTGDAPLARKVRTEEPLHEFPRPLMGLVIGAVEKGRKGAAATKRARAGTKTRTQINAEYRAKMGKRSCTVEGCKSGQHMPGLCAYHGKLAGLARRAQEMRAVVAKQFAARAEQQEAL